jgi:LPXTG-motif cell wall-anchored protein
MSAARRRVALAALALAGMFPSTALAQTAGDEQYQDPFGGEAESTPPPAEPAPAAPAPAAPAPAAETPAPAAPAAAPPASAPAPQLPYTGADAGLVALAGGLLLAGGVGLRVRLRERA